MTKNALIPKDDLMDYFKNIIELENRKITYDKAILEVEQEIENAKAYNSYAQPYYPKVKYDTGVALVRVLIIFFGLWYPFFKFIGLKIEFIRNLNAVLQLIIWGALVIGFEIFLAVRAHHKAKRQYEKECNEVDTYNRQQKEEAEKRTELILAEKSPNLNEWRSFNNKIQEHLQYLYNMSIIPAKYQNAVAISFFVSYLESGRCDTLKECMNKYDDDAMYYQLKGKLEDIYQRIGEMEGRLSREIRYLQSSFESDLQDIKILVDNNSSQIDRISYNQRTNALLSAALLIDN